MGRFLNDFTSVASSIGVIPAFHLVAFPRIASRFSNYTCNELFNQAVDNFIHKYLGKSADNPEFTNVQYVNSAKESKIPDIIWVFWWQGEDAMPDVIKECYESVKRNANGREIRLITQSNYSEWIKLPVHIDKKFRNHIISFPHFSDIIRLQLLYNYGGLWLDAAVFVTKPIVIPNSSFYSPRITEEASSAPHLSQWVIGVMGGECKHPLFRYVYQMLIDYWAKYDAVFSYLMFDYFIRYGYEHIKWIKDLIDSRPIDSPNFFETRYTFNNEVDYQHLNSLLENNTFISLTYRIPYNNTTENGKETYFAALLKHSKN